MIYNKKIYLWSLIIGIIIIFSIVYYYNIPNVSATNLTYDIAINPTSTSTDTRVNIIIKNNYSGNYPRPNHFFVEYTIDQKKYSFLVDSDSEKYYFLINGKKTVPFYISSGSKNSGQVHIEEILPPWEEMIVTFVIRENNVDTFRPTPEDILVSVY